MPRNKTGILGGLAKTAKTIAPVVAGKAVESVGITMGFLLKVAAPITAIALVATKAGLSLAHRIDDSNIARQGNLEDTLTSLREKRETLTAADRKFSHISRRELHSPEVKQERRKIRTETALIDKEIERVQKEIYGAGSGMVVRALSKADQYVNSAGEQGVQMLRNARDGVAKVYAQKGAISASQEVAGMVGKVPFLPTQYKTMAKAYAGDAAGVLAEMGGQHFTGNELGEKMLKAMCKATIKDSVNSLVESIRPDEEMGLAHQQP